MITWRIRNRIIARSTDALDDVAAGILGGNRTDLRGLDWLSEGPMAAGQLTEAIGLSTAATTALIDRLERKGLVRRLSDPADRRRVLIEMTDLGKQRSEAIYRPLRVDGSTMLARYEPVQLEVLLGGLTSSREITDRHRRRLLNDGIASDLGSSQARDR